MVGIRFSSIAIVLAIPCVALAADLCISVPDAAVPRIIDAYTETYQYYPPTPLPGETPFPTPSETKAQFTQRVIRLQIRDTVMRYEQAVAQAQAKQTAQAAVKTAMAEPTPTPTI